ncbi:MAG: septal ring lytic transglycosylase RlpA family protein [Lautropia sp.]
MAASGAGMAAAMARRRAGASILRLIAGAAIVSMSACSTFQDGTGTSVERTRLPDPAPVATPLPAPTPAPAPVSKPSPPAPKPPTLKEEAAALMNVADAVPRQEALKDWANRPYVNRGRRYVPMTHRRAFTQRGEASWYGRPFHGRKTATGERYDMRAMTAAHPTLPLPSYVKVTSLETGRTIVVRVNDRGPYAQGRVIDLSFAAAAKLGFTDRGTTPVEISLIIPPATPAARQAQPRDNPVLVGTR